MDALRFHALLIGMLCGYALALWAGMCGPAGECLTWSVLDAIGGVGVLAQEAAALLLDDGQG
jgi:hypothetical protein